MEGHKEVTEAQVRKAVQRALKHVLNEIENEPTLVIDSDDNGENLSDETIADIREWLFDREVRP